MFILLVADSLDASSSVSHSPLRGWEVGDDDDDVDVDVDDDVDDNDDDDDDDDDESSCGGLLRNTFLSKDSTLVILRAEKGFLEFLSILLTLNKQK